MYYPVYGNKSCLAITKYYYIRAYPVKLKKTPFKTGHYYCLNLNPRVENLSGLTCEWQVARVPVPSVETGVKGRALPTPAPHPLHLGKTFWIGCFPKFLVLREYHPMHRESKTSSGFKYLSRKDSSSSVVAFNAHIRRCWGSRPGLKPRMVALGIAQRGSWTT